MYLKRIALGVLLLTIIPTITLAQGQTQSEFLEKLDHFIPKKMEAKKVPGVAIVIIDNGKPIYKKGIGWADKEATLKVSTQTGFNIGSISKMFTAWGVLKLAEEGKINIDSSVERYLTRWKLPDSEFDRTKVTVRGLLSHTAGLSVHGYPGFAPEAKLPTIEASLDGENGPVRANEKVMLIHEPQTKFKYSGGGYTILQLMIEEVTKKPFAQYMQTEIFDPLQMKAKIS